MDCRLLTSDSGFIAVAKNSRREFVTLVKDVLLSQLEAISLK